MDVLSLNLPPCCHISFPYITSLDIKTIHQWIQTTCLHVASRCHHHHYCHQCNVDFMLFHNITCYTNSLLSRIHGNIAYLLNITCTLVATSMILGRLESIDVDCWTLIGPIHSSTCTVLDMVCLSIIDKSSCLVESLTVSTEHYFDFMWYFGFIDDNQFVH